MNYTCMQKWLKLSSSDETERDKDWNAYVVLQYFWYMAAWSEGDFWSLANFSAACISRPHSAGAHSQLPFIRYQCIDLCASLITNINEKDNNVSTTIFIHSSIHLHHHHISIWPIWLWSLIWHRLRFDDVLLFCLSFALVWLFFFVYLAFSFQLFDLVMIVNDSCIDFVRYRKLDRMWNKIHFSSCIKRMHNI